MIKKFITFSISLLIVFSLQSQEKSLIKKPHKKTSHPLTARDKYNIYLEQNDFFAFNSDDFNLDNTSKQTSTTTSNKILKPSLYSQFNLLPAETQDHITEYLQAKQLCQSKLNSTEKLILVDNQEKRISLIKNCKENIKSYLDILCSSNKSKHQIKYIKECLRIEYWNRYVAHAVGQNPIVNNRMQPSPICDSTSSICNDYFNNICAGILYPEDSLEIIALMISCGMLINKNKLIKRTPLYYAIQNDSLPIIRLLMKSGLVNICGLKKTHAKSLKPTPLIIFAAENNALKTVQYLHDIGHNLNVQDETGNTALHRAHLFGRQTTVDLLLSLGADSEVKNNVNQKYSELNFV